MVLLDEGLNQLATRTASDITKGQWGTDTTAATPTDTGLGTAVATTLLAFDSSTASGNSVQFQHTTPSTTGNGNTLAEYEVQFDDGNSLNRSVGASFAKTASFDVTTITTVNFVRG